MHFLWNLWREETGFIISAEMILIAAIVVLGLIVGLTVIRDTIITELADTGTAFGQINQSYSYAATTGHTSSVAGAFFNDTADFCDSTSSSITGTGTGCTTFLVPASQELGTM